MRLALKLGAVLLLGSLLGGPVDAGMLLSAAPAAGGGPTQTAAPTLTPAGPVAVGATVTCHAGSWTPTATTHSFQFFRGGSTSVKGPGTPGAGTTDTYIVASGDTGGSLTCVDIAAAGGPSTTSSQSTPPVTVSASTVIARQANTGLAFVNTTSNVATFNYTIQTNNNTGLFVVESSWTSTGSPALNTVVVDPTGLNIACTQIGSTNSVPPNTNTKASAWFCPIQGTAPGARNIVLTFAGSTAVGACVAEYTGVAQTSAFEGFSTNTSVGTASISTPVTTTLSNNEWLMGYPVGPADLPTTVAPMATFNPTGVASCSGLVANVAGSGLLDSNGTVTTISSPHTVSATFSVSANSLILAWAIVPHP